MTTLKDYGKGGGTCVVMVLEWFAFLSKSGTVQVIMDFSTSSYDKVVGTETEWSRLPSK